MRKLLVILGLLGSFAGYQINSADIQELLNSSEYTAEEKATAIDEVTNSLENTYEKLQNGTYEFGTYHCNNY